MLKRVCYNCCKNVHFTVQCPYERKEEDNNKGKKFDKGYKKARNILRRSLMVKLMLSKKA
jgi:hypothetical protein